MKTTCKAHTDLDEFKATGGPAFATGTADGMTLLDYFAGQALAGMLVNDPPDRTYRLSAAMAYEMAIAMIAERERLKAYRKSGK